MRTCLSFILTTCFFVAASGQTDSLPKNIDETIYKPAITLNRDDIRRLPVSNFMELVNQSFSFLPGNTPAVKDYSFIVNGFISVNPNAINIAQIDRIEFYPAGTYQTQGSLHRNGCFVITLLREEVKNALSFSTRTGIRIYNKDYEPPFFLSTAPFTYNDSWFSLNELSFLNQNQRSTVNSSFSYNKDDFPYAKSSEEKFRDHLSRYRFSNYLRHSLTNQLTLHGNVILSSFKRGGELFQKSSFSSIERKLEQGLRHAHASLGVDYKPTDRFSNATSFEYNIYRSHGVWKGYHTSSFSARTDFTDSLVNRQNRFVFTNTSGYRIVSGKELSLNAVLMIRYRESNDEEDRSYRSFSGGGPGSQSESKNKALNKSISLSPGIEFSWKNILQARGNAMTEKYTNSMWSNRQEKFLVYPEIFLGTEFADLLKIRFLSGSNLFLAYRKFFNEDMQKHDPMDPAYFISGPFWYFNKPEAATLFTSGVGIGLLNNRLKMRVSYLRDERMIYDNPVLFIPDSYPLERTAWSTELSAKLIQRLRSNWIIDAVMVKDEFKFKNGSPSSLKDKKDQWRGSVRTRAEFGNLFFQGSLLLSFNEARYDSTGVLVYDDNHNMNYLLLGYRIQRLRSKIRYIEISAQSRNLILPKYPLIQAYANRYFGLGLAVGF